MSRKQFIPTYDARHVQILVSTARFAVSTFGVNENGIELLRAALFPFLPKPITLEQAKALTRGYYVYSTKYRNSDGSPMMARVTGKVKTWKKDAKRIYVPVRHGLKDNYHIDENNLDEFTLEGNF